MALRRPRVHAEIARGPVDGVIEGSVSRSNTTPRHCPGNRTPKASARLGQTTSGEVKDAFALQGEIARTITGQPPHRAHGPERLRLARLYTAKPDAQDLYLRGDCCNAEPRRHARSVPALREAVQIDGYGSAWRTRAVLLVVELAGLMASGRARSRAPLPRQALSQTPGSSRRTRRGECGSSSTGTGLTRNSALPPGHRGNPNFALGRWMYASSSPPRAHCPRRSRRPARPNSRIRSRRRSRAPWR